MPSQFNDCRPHLLSPDKLKFIKAELDAFLKVGIIDELHSPWASPMVLVPKNDERIRRLCTESESK